MALFIVPTPIGNLADITLRALSVLKDVEAILCEDTRNSRVLLNHYNISKPLIAYHQHNEHHSTDRLVEEMLAGKNYALISDAGTPAISDPGFLLVRACRNKGVLVTCLPGATAFVPALVQSGLPSNSFCFDGFLPLKKGRQTQLKKIAASECTTIIYESPHRLLKTLKELRTYIGAERRVAVCRELTKIHEEVLLKSIEELLEHYEVKGVKGELVLVIEGLNKKYMPSEENK